MNTSNQDILNTSLLNAAQAGNIDACKTAVEEGADLQTTDMWGGTVLHTSTSKGFLELTRWLLEQGLNPNQQNAKGRTPLHLAAGKNYNQITYILLKAGANPNIRNMWGLTCLHWAVISNAIRSVTTLKDFKYPENQAKLDMSLFTPEGKLAIDLTNNQKMLKVLLE